MHAVHYSLQNERRLHPVQINEGKEVLCSASAAHTWHSKCLSQWPKDFFLYEFNILILGVELTHELASFKRNVYGNFHNEFEVAYV